MPYLLLARSPTRWWLWTGALALPFFALVLLVTPIFIAPLFNKFGPMKDKALEAEVLAVAARAGVEGARVFEVDKSVDTEKVNAYVTGVGSTKRIVLWDTLLARLSPRQMRFVVGHELGHYVLGHVVVSIFVSSALTLLGLYGVAPHGRPAPGPVRRALRLHRISDPASMPLFMLLLSLFSLVITPAALALSRHHEHSRSCWDRRSGRSRPAITPLGSKHARKAWKQFLQMAVKRYGPGGSYWTLHYKLDHPGKRAVPIKAWQVWNEPNLQSAMKPPEPAPT